MEKITCPNCTFKFDIEGAFVKDLEAQYQEKLKLQKQEIITSFEEKKKMLEAKEVEFDEKKKRENEIFKQKLESARQEQYELIQNKVREDYTLQLKAQSKELQEKTAKLQKMQQAEIELAKMQRKMAEIEKDMELKMQRKLIQEQKEMEDKISFRIHQEMEMKLEEKNKQLEDQRKLIQEMKRKSEQGSMQMQGEIQELAIERILMQQFPYDKIAEIPKGIRGADTIQIVVNKQLQECGKIIYESKRTKAFSNDWIDKIKNDQRVVMADLAVIVTETLPKELDRFGQVKDVWICTFQEFKSLSFILRDMLIKTMEVRAVQENKGDKMDLLYDYLTSAQFRMRITGIMDAFQQLKEDLDKEKRAMYSIWKKREKQLENVLLNTADMYGSIRGIGGKEIQEIQQLELPGSDDNYLDQ